MCGIIGGNKPLVEKKIDFTLFLASLKHRGPDHKQVFTDSEVFLGHTRLSIVGLSPEYNQPLQSTDLQKRYVLVYNGEIYNYRELSKSAGLPYRPNDAAFILDWVLLKGLDHFNEFRGMYAFALYDKQEKTITLVRDPQGIKPLYYTISGTEFIFCSELQALTKFRPQQIHQKLIPFFFATGFIPEPFTAYSEVLAVEPGSTVSYQLLTHTLERNTFFKFDFTTNKNHKLDASLLKKAVERNLLSDVPVQFALSGGIDSSLLLAFAPENNKAITITHSDKEYDESDAASYFAQVKKAQHVIINSRAKGSFDEILILQKAFGQPFVDSSVYAFSELCREAAKGGKVLIGGDGGDELFAGYTAYRVLPWLNLLRKFPFKHLVNGKLNSLLASKSEYEMLLRWITWDQGIWQNLHDREQALSVVYKLIPETASFEQNITAFYLKLKLPSQYLRKADIVSMQHSLEYRVPMLDEDLTQNALHLPYHSKENWKLGKKPLRKLHRQFYGKHYNNPKKGFDIPLEDWLGKNEMLRWRAYLLDNKSNIYNPYSQGIENLFNILDQKNYKTVSREGVYHRLLALTAYSSFF